MKIRYQYFIFCILLIFLCSCNKSKSSKLYDVPPGYGNDYEIAEFERFNSYASENGLGGTKIMLEGKLEDLFLYDLGLADKTKTIGAYLVSGRDEKWVVLLDCTPYREMSDYEDLEGHIVALRGHYDGYSDLFSMPVICVNSGYDRNTGNFFSSATYDIFYASEDDSETSDSYKTKKSPTSDFDSKTNVTVEHYGISFEIPKNWANLEVIGEGIYYNNRKFLLGYTENETDLELTKNGVIEGLKEVENIKNFKVKSSEKYHFKTFKKEYYKILGSGTMANKDVNIVYIVFEANNGMITMGVFDEQEDEYDYSEDFDKIIDTIIINDDKDSSFSGTKSDNPRDNSIAFGTSLNDSNSSVFTLHDISFRVPNDFKINYNNTSDDMYEFYKNSYGSEKIVKLLMVYQDDSGEGEINEEDFVLVRDVFADSVMKSFDNVKKIDSMPIKMAGKNGYLCRFDGESQNYPFNLCLAFFYNDKAIYSLCFSKSTGISEDFTDVLHDIIGSMVIGNISQSQDTVTPNKDNKTENGIRPEIKEAIDSYESFFDDYVDFMKKYKNNPGDISLLSDYMDYLSKLSDMEQKFKAIEDEDLTNEEALYYAEVSLRIEQKMLEVLK